MMLSTATPQSVPHQPAPDLTPNKLGAWDELLSRTSELLLRDGSKRPPKQQWGKENEELGRNIELALAESGLFQERPELAPVLRKLNPGRLGPTWFPFAASMDSLDLVTLYVVTFFLYDDVIEDMLSVHEIELIGHRTLVALRAIDDKENFELNRQIDAAINKHKMTSFMKLIEDIGARFQETMPRHIHNTFSAGNRGYIGSLADERILLDDKTSLDRMPSLSDFLSWRRTNVGGTVVALLAEFCADVCLEDALARTSDKRILKVTAGLNNMMLFQNDLASISRDAGRLNLVFAMMDEMGVELSAATESTKLLYQSISKQVMVDALSLAKDKPYLAEWVVVVTATFAGLAKYHSSFTRYQN